MKIQMVSFLLLVLGIFVLLFKPISKKLNLFRVRNCYLFCALIFANSFFYFFPKKIFLFSLLSGFAAALLGCFFIKKIVIAGEKKFKRILLLETIIIFSAVTYYSVVVNFKDPFAILLNFMFWFSLISGTILFYLEKKYGKPIYYQEL